MKDRKFNQTLFLAIIVVLLFCIPMFCLNRNKSQDSVSVNDMSFDKNEDSYSVNVNVSVNLDEVSRLPAIKEPYVGMEVNSFDRLTCGVADGPVNMFYEEIDGERVFVKIYTVCSYGQIDYILHCANDVVVKVVDYATIKEAYDKIGRKSSKNNNNNYDVNDYTHPDDFYYDHIDDFVDFEEAEDYFYQHTSK